MKYKLSVELNKYAKSLDNKLEEIVNQTLDYTYKELIDAMPVRSGVYLNNTDIDYAKRDSDGLIKGRAYNNVMTAKSGKWKNVPLACLLEWGTGIVGQGSNTYPHGYPYRQTPWTYYDKYLHMLVTTNGMIARPHWYPTYEKASIKIEQLLKERL